MPGNYWSAGFYWQPSPKFSLELTKGNNDRQGYLNYAPTRRTQLSASYVKRDVGVNPGKIWYVDASHKTRRSTWSLKYSEDLTNDTIQAVTDRIPIGVIFDEQGAPIIVTYDLIGTVNEQYVRANTTAGVTYSTGKSTLRFVLSDEQRDYEVTLRHVESQTATAGWRWKFASRTSLDLSQSVSIAEEISYGKRAQRISDIILSRNIGRRTTGRLGLRRADVEQQELSQSYVENRVFASLSMKF